MQGATHIMALKGWLERIKRSVNNVPTNLKIRPSSPSLATEDLMQSLTSFQALLTEARITILNDFMSKILSDFPPYEAWPTFYNIIINPNELGVIPTSLRNHTRLVGSLKRYMELPGLAVDHLLDMVTILDDWELINEAKCIATDYARVYPDSTSAVGTLLVLHADGALTPTSESLHDRYTA